MSTRIRTTSPKTAKPRTSKARARTPKTRSAAAVLDTGTAMPWPQDLRAGLAAAELMLAEAGAAVSELATTTARQARNGSRRAIDYAREHPAQVVLSAVALAAVVARLWSARATARS